MVDYTAVVTTTAPLSTVPFTV